MRPICAVLVGVFNLTCSNVALVSSYIIVCTPDPGRLWWHIFSFVEHSQLGQCRQSLGEVLLDVFHGQGEVDGNEIDGVSIKEDRYDLDAAKWYEAERDDETRVI